MMGQDGKLDHPRQNNGDLSKAKVKTLGKESVLPPPQVPMSNMSAG